LEVLMEPEDLDAVLERRGCPPTLAQRTWRLLSTEAEISGFR